MGFRFSRRIRLIPGVRLNLSKSGVSTSIGGRGAWLTFGKRGTRATVGLPGTGLSYSTTVAGRRSTASSAPAPSDPVPEAPRGNPRRGYLWMIIILLMVMWTLFRALSG